MESDLTIFFQETPKHEQHFYERKSRSARQHLQTFLRDASNINPRTLKLSGGQSLVSFTHMSSLVQVNGCK